MREPALGAAVPHHPGAVKARQRQASPARLRPNILTKWAIQGILKTRRWLPHRRITVVGDSSFAILEVIAAVPRHVRLITRLRLDASLFAPVPQRRPGQTRHPALKGKRFPTLSQMLANPATVWMPLPCVTDSYDGATQQMYIASGVAVWYHAGLPSVPARVLECDPANTREPPIFLCTNLQDPPADLLASFVSRWRIETTFQEV